MPAVAAAPPHPTGEGPPRLGLPARGDGEPLGPALERAELEATLQADVDFAVGLRRR